MKIGQINAEVDGKKVTVKEAMQAMKYCYKHRKEYSSQADVERALIYIVRKIRGDKNNAEA